MIELATEQWLSMEEVCQVLGISRSTWAAVRRRHGGPQNGQVQLGRKLWWRRDALLDWLRDCEESSDINRPAPRALAPAEPAARVVPLVAPDPVSGYRSRTRDLYRGVGEPIGHGRGFQ